MKESIITPKYAVLSSEEFWCHVLDPKTQGWIWERSAKCVGSSNRTVILQKKKIFAEFSGAEVQHETTLTSLC